MQRKMIRNLRFTKKSGFALTPKTSHSFCLKKKKTKQKTYTTDLTGNSSCWFQNQPKYWIIFYKMYDSYPWQSKHYLNILEPYLFISYSYFSLEQSCILLIGIYLKNKQSDRLNYLLVIFSFFSKAIHLKFTFFFLMVTSPFY